MRHMSGVTTVDGNLSGTVEKAESHLNQLIHTSSDPLIGFSRQSTVGRQLRIRHTESCYKVTDGRYYGRLIRELGGERAINRKSGSQCKHSEVEPADAREEGSEVHGSEERRGTGTRERNATSPRDEVCLM